MHVSWVSSAWERRTKDTFWPFRTIYLNCLHHTSMQCVFIAPCVYSHIVYKSCLKTITVFRWVGSWLHWLKTYCAPPPPKRNNELPPFITARITDWKLNWTSCLGHLKKHPPWINRPTLCGNFLSFWGELYNHTGWGHEEPNRETWKWVLDAETLKFMIFKVVKAARHFC